MRRGRIIIYLALIIIIGVAAVALYYWRGHLTVSKPAVGTPTPQIRYVGIITAGQNISPGTVITDSMLSSIQIPEDKVVQGLFTNKSDVVKKYAKYAIMQGVIITDSMVSASPGSVSLSSSSWAPLIPQGLTAISIPVTRLSSAAFAIRDGDYVDVIVTMLVVDIDPASQTILPNVIAGLEQDTTNTSILKITQGDITQGRFEVDQIPTDPVTPTILYVQPSEKQQRGRLVTQMLMQNIQVLHTGTFALPGETTPEQSSSSNSPATVTPTPGPANQPQAAPAIVKPDVITLMVSPQDAVTLTYLIYSGAQINLTLRNPNDQTPITQPDAATLEYLLTQYNIPVPAKLPYSTQPRLDLLQQPILSNDVTPHP